MASKYVDTSSIIQVIGNVYNNPKLLEINDKYNITEEDFPNMFHRILFGTIYNLYELGANNISLITINDYLESRPKYQAIYEEGGGDTWLTSASGAASAASFDYYYSRLKKMTLLRAYEKYGIDVSDLYDPNNIIDLKKKQRQEDWLDNSSLSDIAEKVNQKIDDIYLKYVNKNDENAFQAGDNIEELIERLKEEPEVGVPLYGSYINTVTRGARLKKFYLRSAATGIGKSRSLIADSCYIGCDTLYYENCGWVKNGVGRPTLFITTEQEKEEVQTMMLAFLSNVNEEHILNGQYLEGEEQRVYEAAKVLKNSPLYIEELPDFSLQDIEDTIKKNIREHGVEYVFNPQRVKGLCNTFPVIAGVINSN